MNDLRYLAKRMGQHAKGVEVASNNTAKDAARAALFELVMGTPIDVGVARSNWKVGIGSPFMGTRQGAFRPFLSRWRKPKGKGGSMGDRSNLAGVMQQAMVKLNARKTDEVIYISNQLPYIEPLNNGHSKQVRPGFINRAMASAKKQVSPIAAKHLKREIG